MSPCLTGQEHVISTERFPDRLESGTVGSGCARVFFVEQRPLEGACKERVEPHSVALLALALHDAVSELECNDLERRRAMTRGG